MAACLFGKLSHTFIFKISIRFQLVEKTSYDANTKIAV